MLLNVIYMNRSIFRLIRGSLYPQKLCWHMAVIVLDIKYKGSYLVVALKFLNPYTHDIVYSSPQLVVKLCEGKGVSWLLEQICCI